MGYKPNKRTIFTVYTDDIEGELRVSAETEDDALRKVQKMGFKIRHMRPDFGLEIKLPPRKL